ncbi:hypothetical protein CAPTEDRAFT_106768 [Capitella teleta]|uniref:Amino acid permease/ SLC12A domain-containing protein n=1 Tax=Capitella teleta TaxID=283909 RepID=R7U592_CAPTE|nr:hypothetical protein CAPTEDRAFT_106768 [Capitella teleta]|eukprot:ELT98846.1 hypothetical protein CAPTEDRAFT_106768 [Capitella teleta]
MNLKPKVTLLNGITIIVGGIIGSGIFISPKGVTEYTGSVGLSLAVWLGCGLFSMVGAHCFNELGTIIVKSGADYAYIREAFGPFLGFLRLWVECIVVKPGINAVIAMTFALYVLTPMYPDCDIPPGSQELLAAGCIGQYTSNSLTSTPSENQLMRSENLVKI